MWKNGKARKNHEGCMHSAEDDAWRETTPNVEDSITMTRLFFIISLCSHLILEAQDGHNNKVERILGFFK